MLSPSISSRSLHLETTIKLSCKKAMTLSWKALILVYCKRRFSTPFNSSISQVSLKVMSLHLCKILFATATVVAQVKQYVSLRDAVWNTFYPLSSFVYFCTILFVLKILSFQ